MRTSLVALCALALATTPTARASARGLCAALERGDAGNTRVAVLSAFPAELAPLVAAVDVQETVTIDGRVYYLATVGGVRIVLGLMGIGMMNAATTAGSVLDHFEIVGMVVSGVAGSTHRIADVVVPDTWVEGVGGWAFRTNVALRALARAAAGDVTLGRCTDPPTFPGTTVCLPHQPEVFPGGRGRSMGFEESAVACTPGAGDIFGCEVPGPAAVQMSATSAPAAAAEEEQFVAEDMETAALVRVATEHRLPSIAFRAVSDGEGDPLGLPGFPTQFFAYYRLAGENAAAVTLAFLRRLGALGDGSRAGRRACALLARRQWHQAAHRLSRSTAHRQQANATLR